MKAKYERKRHIITDIETGEATDHVTVNKAKKASRKLQEANGGLGMGSLVVKK